MFGLVTVRTEPDGGRKWLMAYAPIGAKGIYIYRNTCVVFIFTQPLYMLLDIGEELTPGYISILQSYHVSKYEPKPVESLLPIRVLYREQRNPRMSCQKTICTSREYAMCLHSIQVHFAQTPRICNLRQD